MATIEERAHSAYCGSTTCTPENKIQHFCVNCLHDGRKKAYIKGAEEQKQIDIEKACEWFTNYLFDVLGCPDDWCRSGEEEFKKAMEE